jgi:hypothetical protein
MPSTRKAGARISKAETRRVCTFDVAEPTSDIRFPPRREEPAIRKSFGDSGSMTPASERLARQMSFSARIEI